MSHIPYDERVKTYTNALVTFGEKNQCIVAVEELSEVQKEICKVLRGKDNLDHLAEEIADATIMLEQIRLIFGINDLTNEWIDIKVKRLDDNMKKK